MIQLSMERGATPSSPASRSRLAPCRQCSRARSYRSGRKSVGRPRPVGTRVSGVWLTSPIRRTSSAPRAQPYAARASARGRCPGRSWQGSASILAFRCHASGPRFASQKPAGSLGRGTVPGAGHELLVRTDRPCDHLGKARCELADPVDDVGIAEMTAIADGFGEPGRRCQPFLQRRERDSEVFGEVFVRGTHQGKLAGILGEFRTIRPRRWQWNSGSCMTVLICDRL